MLSSSLDIAFGFHKPAPAVWWNWNPKTADAPSGNMSKQTQKKRRLQLSRTAPVPCRDAFSRGNGLTRSGELRQGGYGGAVSAAMETEGCSGKILPAGNQGEILDFPVFQPIAHHVERQRFFR